MRAIPRRLLIFATLLVPVVATGAIALWRWHEHITTPPLRLTVDEAAVLPIDGARMAAEWERAAGVLIAWPLRLPRDLVDALASRGHLYVTVADEASRADAAAMLVASGIRPDAFTLIAAPQGDGWYGTRDWGPFAVFDVSGRYHLVDARYVDYSVCGPADDDTLYWLSRLDSLDFAPDDEAPAAVARLLGVPRVQFPYALTGGAIETDGLGTAIVTNAIIRENEALGVPKGRLLAAARSLLGIERLIILPNYETMGVHHVDCLLKLLDPERVLVQRPPRDHEQQARVEAIVELLAKQRTPSGATYEILRIDAPRYRGDDLANYINALIFNGAVFVPLFGIPGDEAALATWRTAMPDYEILGFEHPGDDGWTYTDALHCRTKAIWRSTP